MIDLANLPAQYDHAAAQEKWYAHWEASGYFHAKPTSEKPPFSIVIPPPNVTGALHLGHALNNTLQDILCRMKRMQGYNVLWMPGTDHAGIATQAVVERRLLQEEGKSRHDLGREGLVERIWQWKEQYEARITGQLKKLGCSCDWQRQRFTLDEQCARAVRETFFKLFADGKIYRGKRLVNWDTYLQTAVSDDEVFHEEVKGHFWSFHYPVIDPKPGEPEQVTIATTRPETMLGDTAVAVHPDPEGALAKTQAELEAKLAAASDKEKPTLEKQLETLRGRRQSVLPRLIQLRDMALRGTKLRLPLTDREISLITDEWAKPELGSGCVKITPAHDANDYEVWQRHKEIGAINILNTDGTLNDSVPEPFCGLTMKKARTAVIEALAEGGFHDPETDVEDRLIDLAHSDRSKTPIEPYLADQWFVKMDQLAQTAMDAVTSGKVRIKPERYTKTYLDWLSEKRDWPVGRQLWWGHRIPVWTGRAFFATEKPLGGDNGQDLQEGITSALTSYMKHMGVTDAAFRIEWTDRGHCRLCVGSQDAHDAATALESKVSHTKLSKLEQDANPCKSYTVPGFDRALKLSLGIGGLTEFSQENDVLDTWFSSALWPHSTMGWPEETDLLDTFYPTSTLITSRDIITLWVARMVLMGEYNMGEVPFPEVYIHPKILDGYGETMSKSKGNGVDPLDVIDRFGADALRFGIAYLTTETQDVRMPVEFVCPHCDEHLKQTKKNRVLPRVECDKCGKAFRTQWAENEEDLALPRGAVTSERFELGRNFCNKLWNASRFALQNLASFEPPASAGGGAPTENLRLEDRWLLSRLATVTKEVTEALESYRYADAARALYDFAWNEFCSFYVEMTKSRFASEGDDKRVAQRVLAHGLDVLLRLLHPMTPFLTEEVWHLLGEVVPRRAGVGDDPARESESICVAPWPEVDASAIDSQIEKQFASFQAVLGAVREVRQTQGIAWSETLEFAVECDAQTAKLLEPMTAYFIQMAKANPVAMGSKVPAFDMAASKTLGELQVHVDVSQFIDLDAERERLGKERAKLAKFVKSLEGKLKNEKFVANAPAEIVAAEREKLADAERQFAAVEAAVAKLS